jgi:hypothetical protein
MSQPPPEIIHHADAPASPRIRGKIPLTIIGGIVIAALAAIPFAEPPPATAFPDAARFTGRFHPLILHLPIGILAWVLFHELLSLVSADARRSSSRTAMGCAAASAVVSSLLGVLLLHSTPDYDPELSNRHLYGGLAFSGLAVASWIVKLWVDAAAGRGSRIYRVLLLVTAAVMTITSHDGASLTHGRNHLTEYAPDPLRRLLGLPEKTRTVARDDPDMPDYTTVIQPVFERKCYPCHNIDKSKGRYRMDDYNLLIAGGRDGEAIVPGNADASNLIVRIELPEDDEEHMPPEGKPDLTPDEVELIRRWIDLGAPENNPADHTQKP